jgi:hypothetical protein
MARLDNLTLIGVGLNGRSAARVFSEVVPSMVHLRCLALRENNLGVGPATMLAYDARKLPALRSVEVSEGNDLVEPGDGVPGTVADMNWIVGRDLFF